METIQGIIFADFSRFKMIPWFCIAKRVSEAMLKACGTCLGRVTKRRGGGGGVEEGGGREGEKNRLPQSQPFLGSWPLFLELSIACHVTKIDQ